MARFNRDFCWTLFLALTLGQYETKPGDAFLGRCNDPRSACRPSRCGFHGSAEEADSQGEDGDDRLPGRFLELRTYGGRLFREIHHQVYEVLGNLWLKQTYDFPPGQFGGNNEPGVTGEALIGFDADWGQWVRFFATSHGEYFPIRMKETGDGWAYRYFSFFWSKPETADADATFTKKSETEYSIDGPTYPEKGKQVTEHHSCRKL
jgi:hypothetical protein